MRRMLLAALAGIGLLAACDDKPPAATLRIVAGSEVRPLEAMLQEFGRANNVTIQLRTAGSLDIRDEIAGGRSIAADVVWPANGMWIQAGDSSRMVTDDDSIMRTPVVFGVRPAFARRLGWDRNAPSIAEILEATRSGGMRLGMTSATQSNSGAQAYLGFLHALSGHDRPLSAEDLDSEDLQNKVRRLLASVTRSSGSSGFLGDFVLENPASVDAFVNYEAVLLDVNRRLVERGAEPFLAVYPRDGLTVADHVIGFVSRPGTPGEEGRRAAYTRLKAWLLEPAQQTRIHRAGWRTGRIGLEMPDADRSVFRPEWGVDASRAISPIRLPAADVVEAALALYQGGGLRRPSHTVILYDVSGSMAGAGIRDARRAFSAILDQGQARRSMLQAGPRDMLRIVPFRNTIDRSRDVRGNSATDYSALLDWVLGIEPNGGTDFYTPILRELPQLQTAYAEGRLPAIILMTDGKSETNTAGELLRMLRARGAGENVPVFSILFGEADPTQLNELARLTGGRVFDGRRDLVRAFRDARGYN